jgi:HK97 family phage portal protein
MFLASAPGRSAGDDFWYMPVAHSAGGARVNADTALRLSTVYKCVRAIAETVGALPMPVYRRLQRGKERGKERDASHPLARLLQVQPNPWQTAMQWREMMQGHASLLGNGYSEIVYNGAGMPDMLLPLHPQRTRVEVAPSGLPRYRTQDAQGRERTLVFGQVLHLAGFSTDGYCGINPVEAEREAIGAAITSRDFGATYFGNAARPPTWIEMPAGAKFKDEESRQSMLRQFHAGTTGVNQGRTPVMDQGMKLHALPLSPADSQWLESRKHSEVDICGLWRVPPHKIGIYDQAKWANVEQAALEWVSDCILPWARRWEQTLLRDLDFGPDHFPEFLLDGLLRGDTKTRYEAYGKAIQDGWMVRNEARERENMNALDGLDEPLEPLNMAPAGSRGADQARGRDPDALLQPAVPPALPDARAVALLQASADRVARKEVALIKRCHGAADKAQALAEAFDGHARFVADVMAVSEAAAADHVAETLARADRWLAGGHALLSDIETTQAAALMRLES